MIKRTLFEQLKQHLAKKEFSLIVGPRQAGKTTLMLLLKEYLEKQGEKTILLNFFTPFSGLSTIDFLQ